jgi:hypothetical protein
MYRAVLKNVAFLLVLLCVINLIQAHGHSHDGHDHHGHSHDDHDHHHHHGHNEVPSFKYSKSANEKKVEEPHHHHQHEQLEQKRPKADMSTGKRTQQHLSPLSQVCARSSYHFACSFRWLQYLASLDRFNAPYQRGSFLHSLPGTTGQH